MRLVSGVQDSGQAGMTCCGSVVHDTVVSTSSTTTLGCINPVHPLILRITVQTEFCGVRYSDLYMLNSLLFPTI
ncbi:MAG: hypothetical protein SFU91_03645 [Chloroherpetonaceae bacterium]|nr:hypothetical protein [Chloroherpetonaceae bacterium]